MAKKTVESGNFLTDMFRDTIKSDKLGTECEYTPNYSSSIDLIDYRNGRIENGEILAGVDGGKIVTIVGKSGSGKSTLAIQLACNIVKPFDAGQVIHMDFENATTKARIKTLSGWNDEMIKAKYIHLNQGIYSESLYSLIKATAKIKLENFEKLQIDTGKVDMNGDPIFALPPTVFLVDSWATVVPKNISEEEELSGQMSATAIARQNNSIIKRITSPLQEANITLVIVNHITQKVEIGPVKTSNTLNYLGQDESIPGGTSAIYMANVLLKLQPGSKLEEDKDFGIKGFYVVGNFLKSRTNEAGRKFELVYSQSEGFDNFLTNFYQMKQAKLLKGNGRAYYFDFAPDTKFTQKNVKQLYQTNEEWAKLFDEAVANLYYDFLNDNSSDDVELLECIDEEQDIWLGSDGNHYFSNGEIVEYED